MFGASENSLLIGEDGWFSCCTDMHTMALLCSRLMRLQLLQPAEVRVSCQEALENHLSKACHGSLIQLNDE